MDESPSFVPRTLLAKAKQRPCQHNWMSTDKTQKTSADITQKATKSIAEYGSI